MSVCLPFFYLIFNIQFLYHIQGTKTTKTVTRGKKYSSTDEAVKKAPTIKKLYEQWATELPPKDPQKYLLNKTILEELLEDNKNPDKSEFIRQMTIDGTDLTQKKTIEMEQGEEEYKMPINEWEFLATKIEEYRGEGKRCIYGPLTKEAVRENDLLKEAKIMPHFIRTTIKEDGSLKLREVTDAASKKEGFKSFNDNVEESEKSLEYLRIIEIIRLIMKCKIKWMVMADAVDAFKRIPIADRFIKYFGVKVGIFYFFWTCLTFGGASSCRIYGWFAAYIVWILVRHNKDVFTIDGNVVLKNYLDDFIAGHSSYRMAWIQYFTLVIWFKYLGIPTQLRKMCEPTKVIKYIGYIINLLTKKLIIPLDKLVKVKDLGLEIVAHRQRKERVKVQLLQSFCGLVRFTVPVYYYIAPLLRSIEEKIGSRDKTEKVWVSEENEKEIRKIINIMMDTKRNEISFEWLTYPKNKGDIITETDASGNIGMGGIERKQNGIYFRVNYNEIPKWNKNKDPDIVWKELAAVWIMHKLQKKAWTGKAILLKVDNKAVEHIMKKKKACFARKDLQVLVGDICEHSMRRNYWHWYNWISTKDNKYSDGLSRNAPEVLDDLEYNLRDVSGKARKLAIIAYNKYLEAKKKMDQREKEGEKGYCSCDKQHGRCREQHQYRKWSKQQGKV